MDHRKSRKLIKDVEWPQRQGVSDLSVSPNHNIGQGKGSTLF